MSQHKYCIKPNLPLHELVPAYRQLIFNFGPGYHPDNRAVEYDLDMEEHYWLDHANDILFHEMPVRILYPIGNQVINELNDYERCGLYDSFHTNDVRCE